MNPPRRAGPLLAALCLAVFPQAAPAGAALTLDPAPAWRHAETLFDLVAVLDAWLDAHSGYAARATAPRVVIVDRQAAALRPGTAARMGQATRGLYDPDSATIILVAPWSPDDARDVSVLLHELVHHRQHTARHWYCPGQQEPDAYRLQAAWLAERGLTIPVNRIAVVLEAGCTRRDIHPD
jgi:hypothetical protein